MTDIHLILSHFDFETPGFDPYDPDSPSRYEYVVGILNRSGSDTTLLALQDHVLPGIVSAPSPQGSSIGPWKDDHFRLFISHTHAHQTMAGEIRTKLARCGVDAFVAHDQIEPSQEWQREIESALATCDALVALLTEDFVTSRWCDQEVGFCFAREILIVPVGVGALPHGFIGKFQGMLAHDQESSSGLASRVFDRLASHDSTAGKMARPIALRYAHSDSYDDTRQNFARLKQIPKELWTPELAEIVESAPARNNQVKNANVRLGEPIPAAATEFINSMLHRTGGFVPDLGDFAPSSEGEIPF